MAQSPRLVAGMAYNIILFICIVGIALSVAGCGTSTSSRSAAVSCYDTGNGVKCIPTDDVSVEPTDVDGNGQPDEFVCGDVASDSDDENDCDCV